jgi:hypothetical protein
MVETRVDYEGSGIDFLETRDIEDDNVRKLFEELAVCEEGELRVVRSLSEFRDDEEIHRAKLAINRDVNYRLIMFKSYDELDDYRNKYKSAYIKDFKFPATIEGKVVVSER